MLIIIKYKYFKNKSKLNNIFNKLLKQFITIIKFLILYKKFIIKLKNGISNFKKYKL